MLIILSSSQAYSVYISCVCVYETQDEPHIGKRMKCLQNDTTSNIVNRHVPCLSLPNYPYLRIYNRSGKRLRLFRQAR